MDSYTYGGVTSCIFNFLRVAVPSMARFYQHAIGSGQRYDLDGQEQSWDSILEAVDTSVNYVVLHGIYTSIHVT